MFCQTWAATLPLGLLQVVWIFYYLSLSLELVSHLGIYAVVPCYCANAAEVVMMVDRAGEKMLF